MHDRDVSETGRPNLPVRALLAEDASELRLTLHCAPAGLDRTIATPRTQKPGLALVGYPEYIHPGRIQVLGNSEITYLRQQSADKRAAICRQLCRLPIACFVVTKGLGVPEELEDAAEAESIPVLGTPLVSSVTLDKLHAFLEDRLCPRTHWHGVLVDTHGLGVLLIGDSGLGKSECALDLVMRGHRLITDDVVRIELRRGHLVGRPLQARFHMMELRGIGLVDIQELFGVGAIRENKYIELVVRLVRWEPGVEIERLGDAERTIEILDEPVPYVEMPVAPGRNLATLVEVAARNQLLKAQGRFTARDFTEKLGRRLEASAAEPQRREPHGELP